MKEFCVVGGSFIVHSGWLPQQPVVNFQLNWLPPDIPLSIIREELEAYTPILSLKKETIDLGDDDLFPTGKVLGSFSVDTNLSLHSLPHFLSFPPYTAHWVIYNRSPICFTCKWVGHTAAKCPTPFCTFCKRLLPRSHSCGKPLFLVDPKDTIIQSTSSLNLPILVKPPVSVQQVSSSSHSMVLRENQFTVSQQNFWVQNKPSVSSQSFHCKTSLELDLSSSSDSDDGCLSSPELNPFSLIPKQDSFDDLGLRKPDTLAKLKTFPFKVKEEKPLERKLVPSLVPTWLPPKGALSLNLDSLGYSHKAYFRKHPKKK